MILAKFTAISIHSLRGEGDIPGDAVGVFLNISIHSLRGEGDAEKKHDKRVLSISIHSLRGEGDVTIRTLPDPEILFQSTPSVGRETLVALDLLRIIRISIHSLRGEGDVFNRYTRPIIINFNPLPPWGGRPEIDKYDSWYENFNPLPPWGGRQ